MGALAVAQRYLDAWNARDPKALAATFAPDGTYSDPSLPDGADPTTTAGYAGGLFTAFPDLAFEIESIEACGEDAVSVQWVMTGTNDGPFMGLPPTGRRVRMRGADVIRMEGDRVRSVEGYFDTAVVPRQLGLQVVVQPSVVGPFAFGTSAYVRRAGTEPGAVSLTVLEARSPEEIAEVSTRSRDVMLELLDTPGFHSWIGVTVGERMYTITAWESPEDVARLKGNAAHNAGMARFFAADGVARGGQTGVWTPHRLNGVWQRCPSCDGMVQRSEDDACRCGEPLPQAPPYW